jgi:uncharacterized protein (DUF427 family)
VYVEPLPRRVRAVVDGRTVVDSEEVLLVHRGGGPPVYAFPEGHVTGLASTQEPAAPGHVTVAWEAADAWFEEDEETFLHARNPYHRVECLRTSRHLRVAVGGVVLVDTTSTTGVYETALPPRLYVARELVRTDVLVRSATTSFCPYKGTASYWSAVVDGMTVADVAWSYDDPLPESEAIRGMLSFYDDRVELTHDMPGAG